MIRGDLSNRLIHLTRDSAELSAEQVLQSIVNERRLRGSTKDIKGGHSVACFTEAPLTALAQMMASDPTAMRYQPFGVMVTRDWLYAQGGRPVIHSAPNEYDALPASMQYRYVRYQPDRRNGDWTWEREWRVPTTSLALDPAHTTLIVPRRAIADAYVNKHYEDLFNVALALEEVGFAVIAPYEWHFVVLEDLGIEFPAQAAAPVSA
ncbi:hypothetical protein [Cupriavidus pampae]|uniref:DUF2971 domain-containing protein n=1 Tax=Cupriavidus pampae TaxID=659251 RepID=A0ABN7ZHL8_9BURK|nr:hypothetical protein [Cupriavidus pampae]CAG9183781.1 hypothetical protein LMG32289_05418 [Cupriavidus pampae]